jgi:hypothetical protein
VVAGGHPELEDNPSDAQRDAALEPTGLVRDGEKSSQTQTFGPESFRPYLTAIQD